MDSTEGRTVKDGAGAEVEREGIRIPEGFKPHWHPVLVRGVKLHLPVNIPWTNYWLFKDGEMEQWDAFPNEKFIVMGVHLPTTGQPLQSPFIKELPPEPAPDLTTSILTMEAVARVLGLASGRAAREFVKRHGVPFIKAGRQYLVLKSALEEFLRAREETSPGKGDSCHGAGAVGGDRLGAVTRAVRRRDAEAKCNAGA